MRYVAEYDETPRIPCWRLRDTLTGLLVTQRGYSAASFRSKAAADEWALFLDAVRTPVA